MGILQLPPPHSDILLQPLLRDSLHDGDTPPLETPAEQDLRRSFPVLFRERIEVFGPGGDGRGWRFGGRGAAEACAAHKGAIGLCDDVVRGAVREDVRAGTPGVHLSRLLCQCGCGLG